MRIDCDAFKDRQKRLWDEQNDWHLYFAWHPVRIARNDCRVFEQVLRRRKWAVKPVFRYLGPLTERVPDGWEYKPIPMPAEMR